MAELTSLLRQQLRSSSSETRIAATKQLATLPNPSMPLFFLSLGDTDWRVRKAAIEIFCHLKHPENLIPQLIRLLHHQENAGLLNAVIEILIALGPRALDDLRSEMTCSDVEVRKFIIDILGEIGDLRCADELIKVLADGDINVRYAAVETLGKLGKESAVDPLLELMNDPDPGLKFIILQSLARIGGVIPSERLSPFLTDRLLRKALFDCFGKVGGNEVIPHLVNGLSDPMRHVRESALLALFALRDREDDTITSVLSSANSVPIAEYFEQLLTGENLQLKVAALAFYACVGRERNLCLLLSCIAEEPIRKQSLEAFSALGQEPYTRLLSMTDETDSQQILSLVFIGGELGFNPALSLAIQGSFSKDPQLRYVSARALGTLGGPEDIAPLLQLLDDEISDISDVAAEALAMIGERHRSVVLEMIIPLLADRDADKRMRIARALRLIDGDEIEGLLLKTFKDPSSAVRCEAIKALTGHEGGPVLSGLTLALTDESAEVRRLAVSALGHCSQNEALPALKLAARDADIWVQAAVMSSLGGFSGEEVCTLLSRGSADSIGLVAIAALESAVLVLGNEARQLCERALSHQDTEVVKTAMKLLGRDVGRDWILPFGEALLNHAHWDVRAQAAKALGNCGGAKTVKFLEVRLDIEDEGLVRQTIETALTQRLNRAEQGR